MALKALMMSKIGNKGFTLAEVMVSTAVLSLGTVLIFESLFMSSRSFNYYSDYLNVLPVIDEKLWVAQNNLRCFGQSVQMDTQDVFKDKDEDFNWHLSYSPIDEAWGLYKIDSILIWQDGPRKIRLTRTAYATHQKRE